MAATTKYISAQMRHYYRNHIQHKRKGNIVEVSPEELARWIVACEEEQAYVEKLVTALADLGITPID